MEVDSYHLTWFARGRKWRGGNANRFASYIFGGRIFERSRHLGPEVSASRRAGRSRHHCLPKARMSATHHWEAPVLRSTPLALELARSPTTGYFHLERLDPIWNKYLQPVHVAIG